MTTNEDTLKIRQIKSFKNSLFPIDVVDKSKEFTTPPYVFTLNSNAFNQLQKIKSSDYKINNTTGTATFKKDNITLQVANFTDISIKELPQTTSYLLAVLILEFNRTGRKEAIINLPIKKYAELRGLLNRKELRKQILRDLALLGNYKITYQNQKQSSKKKKKPCDEDFLNINLSQGVGVSKGNIILHLSDHFFNHFANAYPMPYHLDLLKLNPNTSAFALGHYILSHYNMNFDKTNSNIFSVKSALEACPTIPTKEKAYPHLEQRIIKPFESVMDSLNSVNWDWFYCNSKGVPLTDNELANLKYENFIDCYLCLTIPDHPLTDTKRKIKPIKSKRSK